MAPRRSNKRLRFLALWGTLLYLLVLGMVLYSLENCTERQWFFGALLYLPPEGWLLPLGILLPLALLVRPWVCLLQIGAVVAVFVGYRGHHGPGSKSLEVEAVQTESNAVLTVVTANIGQRNAGLLQRFLREVQPDVIAFQEAGVFSRKFLKEYPDYDLRTEGEFKLASRLPIRRSGIVPDLEYRGRPVAAWFELDYLNHVIVLYSVHMPTPRRFLNEFRGDQDETGGALFSPVARGRFQNYWAERFDLARGLLAVLRKERRPLLVAGDLNTPDHGGLYRLFASQLTDSFAVAGTGGADTFPGNLRGGLLQLGVWMRLDYLFASKDLIPIECRVEPSVRAQHLAVMGRYYLLEPEPEAVPAAVPTADVPVR
jgi:vancomycin resistance protein VanJ